MYHPLFPSSDKKRNEDSQRLMQAVYDNLVRKLKLYPEQWECWIYLHNNIDINDFDYQFTIGSFTQENNVCLYGFNIPDYDIFNIEESYYLFCKRNYASYPIGKDLYDFLYMNKNNSFSLEMFKYKVFEKLFENNVLLKLSDA